METSQMGFAREAASPHKMIFIPDGRGKKKGNKTELPTCVYAELVYLSKNRFPCFLDIQVFSKHQPGYTHNTSQMQRDAQLSMKMLPLQKCTTICKAQKEPKPNIATNYVNVNCLWMVKVATFCRNRHPAKIKNTQIVLEWQLKTCKHICYMIHKTLDKMFSWCSFSGIVHRSCEIHLEGRVYTILKFLPSPIKPNSLKLCWLIDLFGYQSMCVCSDRKRSLWTSWSSAGLYTSTLGPHRNPETRPRCSNELAELTSWANKLELLRNKDKFLWCKVISLKLKFLRVWQKMELKMVLWKSQLLTIKDSFAW